MQARFRDRGPCSERGGCYKRGVERIVREFRKECGPGFEDVAALYAEYRLELLDHAIDDSMVSFLSLSRGRVGHRITLYDFVPGLCTAIRHTLFPVLQ